MRWIGLFNVCYGGLGLAAALYLGRSEGVALCVWVMSVGVAMRFVTPLLALIRSARRRRRIVSRARTAY